MGQILSPQNDSSGGQVGLAGIPAWNNDLLSDYRDVLSRPKFGFSKAAIRSLLAAFPKSGFRQGLPTSIALPDPDDLPFVAVALMTNDKTIITGNPKHFPAHCIKPVTVLSLREAMDVLLKKASKI